MEQFFNGAITAHGIAIFVIIVVIIYVWVLLSAMLDLWAGIRKAKKRGVYRSSKKLRRTVEKLSFYYNVMLALTFVDALLVFGLALLYVNVPRIPYLTFIGALGVGVIEFKSIMEKAEDKQKADVADAMSTLAGILTKEELKELLFKLASGNRAEVEQYAEE